MLSIKVRLKSFEQYNLVIFVLNVGRSGFDSVAESDQKTLKVGIHSFPA